MATTPFRWRYEQGRFGPAPSTRSISIIWTHRKPLSNRNPARGEKWEHPGPVREEGDPDKPEGCGWARVGVRSAPIRTLRVYPRPPLPAPGRSASAAAGGG